jgi:hypothetical protein
LTPDNCAKERKQNGHCNMVQPPWNLRRCRRYHYTLSFSSGEWELLP